LVFTFIPHSRFRLKVKTNLIGGRF